MYEIKITRRVFEFAELTPKATEKAVDELGTLYVDDGIADSVQSARHACNALKMHVDWSICETYEDAHYYKPLQDDLMPSDINEDAISDGQYVGEDIRNYYIDHLDNLRRAETIYNKIEARALDLQDKLDSLCDYHGTLYVVESDEYASLVRAARVADDMMQKASDKLTEYYQRIASEALAVGYADIAIEYCDHFSVEYWGYAFSSNGWFDNPPLFYEDGTISEYNMDDAKTLDWVA